MNVREMIEQAGRKPVLGWVDERKTPINLHKTDIRKTWAEIRKALKKNPEAVKPPG